MIADARFSPNFFLKPDSLHLFTFRANSASITRLVGSVFGKKLG